MKNIYKYIKSKVKRDIIKETYEKRDIKIKL